MVEQRKTARDWEGRFMGPRINCENVPCLPVQVLAWMLDDPRNVPYLMIWRTRRFRKNHRSCARCCFPRNGRRNPVGEMR